MGDLDQYGCYIVVHWYPYMFYIEYAFSDKWCILFYENYCLSKFQLFHKVTFKLLHYYIFSPTYQTVVSDPLFWYSRPDPVVFEEEPEEAAREPQRVGE